MVQQHIQQYINGEWVDATNKTTIGVINPATEEVFAQVADGSTEDVDRAVHAAKSAFQSFSKTTAKERMDLLQRIIDVYESRKDDFITTISNELGATLFLSEKVHYVSGLEHFKQAKQQLETYSFEEKQGDTIIRKEAIGVSGLITPWNFPTNQTVIKIAGALAAGSTVVLKPSELTPISAVILAEVLHEAGVPKGVFNLVNGYGHSVGHAISGHPDIDFVSFTGSNETGKKISIRAAETVKKVALELGGKSPMIILDDFDMAKAAKIALSNVTFNCGQVCTLASRTFIPAHKETEFLQALKEMYDSYVVGLPTDKSTRIGPVISAKQFDRVQYYIEKGVEEGATLFLGGTGKPPGLETGYFVKPTIFTNVQNDMTIAQEEIFGPVMSVMTYDSIDEALEMANDTIYGLAGYVLGNNPETVKYVANEIRAGEISINGGATDYSAPFGGYKQSGIGRECGVYGMEEYLEVKAVLGFT